MSCRRRLLRKSGDEVPQSRLAGHRLRRRPAKHARLIADVLPETPSPGVGGSGVGESFGWSPPSASPCQAHSPTPHPPTPGHATPWNMRAWPRIGETRGVFSGRSGPTVGLRPPVGPARSGMSSPAACHAGIVSAVACPATIVSRPATCFADVGADLDRDEARAAEAQRGLLRASAPSPHRQLLGPSRTRTAGTPERAPHCASEAPCFAAPCRLEAPGERGETRAKRGASPRWRPRATRAERREADHRVRTRSVREPRGTSGSRALTSLPPADMFTTKAGRPTLVPRRSRAGGRGWGVGEWAWQGDAEGGDQPNDSPTPHPRPPAEASPAEHPRRSRPSPRPPTQPRPRPPARAQSAPARFGEILRPPGPRGNWAMVCCTNCSSRSTTT